MNRTLAATFAIANLRFGAKLPRRRIAQVSLALSVTIAVVVSYFDRARWARPAAPAPS
jgi:hypothetical protein